MFLSSKWLHGVFTKNRRLAGAFRVFTANKIPCEGLDISLFPSLNKAPNLRQETMAYLTLADDKNTETSTEQAFK